MFKWLSALWGRPKEKKVMRVKESPKVMPERKAKPGTGKGVVGLIDSSKANAKLPKKPVKKEKYKK